MSIKLNALLDTLYYVNIPKEKVGVYHVHPSRSGDDWGESQCLVAYGEVDKNLSINKKLEKVFMKTNSITDAWWNNKEVTKMFSGKACRSTSIGDIVIIGTNKYKCESTGWSKTAWMKPLHEWKEI